LFSDSGATGDGYQGAETSPIVTRPIDPDTSQSRSGGGGSRLRWLVAGIATIFVVAIVGGALFLAAPRNGTPGLGAHYTPAGTSAYMEMRLDLPGDQKNNLAQFASHFPGFADQASFQQKIDETISSIVKNTGIDWNNDVKPWFGGQVTVFGDIPMPQSSTFSDSSSAIAAGNQFVIVLSVTDKAKLQTFLDAKGASSALGSAEYNGYQIKTIAQPGGTSLAASYVVTDDALIAAPDIDQMRKALDAKDGRADSLAEDTYFLQQLGALHADRLATFYYNLGDLLAAQMGMTGSSSLVPAQCTQAASVYGNAKYVGEVRAEGDHLAFNTRSQLPSGDNAPPAPANRQSNLAQTMPSTTMFYWEVHNLGDTLGWAVRNMLTCMTAMGSDFGASPSPGSGSPSDPSKIFEQLVGAKPDEYLDFVSDAALGVSYANDKIGAGIVATVDDEATAKARVDKVLGLVNLAGGGLGGGSSSQVSSEEIDHNGTKVTVITLSSSLPGSSPMKFQVAVAKGHLYLGMDDFVTSALDQNVNDSLVSNARYQHAVSGAPADTAGIGYLDVAAIIAAYEEALPSATTDDFNTNVKPFLDPLSSVSFVGHVDGGILVSNMNLFVE
jgi:hypothetical protein